MSNDQLKTRSLSLDNAAFMCIQSLTRVQSTDWYDNVEGKTCAQVRDQYYIGAAAFSRWNPAITLDCQGWLAGWSYCVEVWSELQPSVSTAMTTSSTTKKTTTTTPTPKPTPTWVDKGCYLATYTDVTVLSNKSSVASGSALTVAKCKAECYATDFTYAGVMLGNECWCGNGIRNEKASNETECGTPCSGMPSEICGGTARINIFQAVVPKVTTTASTTKTLSSSTSSATTKSSSASTPTGSPAPVWQSLGCYMDPANPRTLTNIVLVPGGSNNMTISACKSACYAGGYQYAGTENGNQCWCDNSLKQTAAEWGPAPDQSSCNKPCTGNASELCGAGARVSIYKVAKPVWLPLGCYEEQFFRILPNKVDVLGGQGNNTRQNCINACDSAGYKYAGVQFYWECYCDNVLNPPALLASDGSLQWYVFASRLLFT